MMQHAEFARFVQPRTQSTPTASITQELSQEDCRASLSVSFARKLPIGGTSRCNSASDGKVRASLGPA
jgi:hypothetical protein